MSHVEIRGPRNEPIAKLSVCVSVMITKRIVEDLRILHRIVGLILEGGSKEC